MRMKTIAVPNVAASVGYLAAAARAKQTERLQHFAHDRRVDAVALLQLITRD